MEHSPDIAARYIRFARDEAAGRSALYEQWARGVADDREILEFLLTLPHGRQQPNLLFAAVRRSFGTPGTWMAFRRILLANADVIRATMLEHVTQTNEANRCATLLPILARLPQPLALIEVGASAGLCLLPDFYAYDYGRRQIRPASVVGEPPVLACTASEATPLPTAMPQIAWRAGLDLNPLDASNPAHAAWLEALVWPEQTRRGDNLRAALGIAAMMRPRIVKGDLLADDLERLCAEAPKDATLVVFHTAVLAYVAGQSAREAFAQRVMSLCPYWISNELPRVFPDVSAGVGTPGRFLLSVNGSAVAWADPHGAALDWIVTVE